MKAAELEARADAAGIPRATVCLAAVVLTPVLEDALHRASRWRWITRAGLGAVLRLLREYPARNCARADAAAAGAGGTT